MSDPVPPTPVGPGSPVFAVSPGVSVPDAAAPTLGPVRRFVRRWLIRLGVLSVLLLVLAYFAPTLAVKLGVVGRVASAASGQLNGTLTIGDASLGWFSPVELRDVTLTDAAGKPILTAPKITSSKWLISLARSQSDLGTFTIESPTVDVVCEGTTTNIEQVLEKILSGPSSPNSEKPAVAVKVTDGKVTFADGPNRWEFTGVSVSAELPKSGPITATATASGGPSNLDAEVTLGQATDLKLKTTAFPLAAAAPFARRFDPAVKLAGTLTSDLTASLQPGQAVKAAGRVTAENLELTAGPLAGEVLKLTKLDLPCDVATADGRVTVNKAELTCDLGNISFAGQFDATQPPEKWADTPGLSATADIDLAQAAKLLPHLLRLRAGTEVREGRVKASLASKPSPAGTVWEGTLATSALRGVQNGRPIAWEQPLQAAFVGRLGADRLPVFETLTANAEFMTVTARGGLNEFTADVSVSLDTLAARASQFIDLSGTTLAGTAKLNVANRPNGKGGSNVSGSAVLTNFAVVSGNYNLSEPQLNAQFSADGVFVGALKLDAGRLTVSAGQDSLEASLIEPIPDVTALQSGRATAKLIGDLARWRNRAAGVVAIPKEYVIGGTGQIAGTVRFDPARIAVSELTGDLTNVRFHGLGLKIDDPQLKVYPTEAVYDRASGVIDIPTLRAASQTMGVGAEKVKVTPTPAGYSISLVSAVSANLFRVQQALQIQYDPKLSDAINGLVRNGTVTLDIVGTVVKFKGTLPVEQFAYGVPQKPLWAEPKLTVLAEGEYDYVADVLTLRSATAQRPSGLTADATGAIRKATTVTELDLSGKLSYDLAELEPKLKEYLGSGAKAVGKDARDFRLTGPLFNGPTFALGGLNGNAGLAWQSLKAYGFDVGQAEMKANLDKGVLKVDPLEAAFGQTGKVRIHPTVRLDTPTYDMTLATGKIVDKAKLTPAATADALGYALPAIAKSTYAEGTISFDLEDNRIPLTDPTAGTLKGKLTLHSVQVGPGPVLTQLLELLGQGNARVTLANEQVVPVRMENRRVHHENLALTVGGYTIRTTGSVGMDSSLQMVADVPVPENAIGPLLRNNPKLREAALNKSIKVNVGGTVSAPKLDRGAFQQAVRQYAEEVAKEAAKGKLNDVVDKQKDKLRGEIEKKLGGLLPIPPQPDPKKP